MAVSRQRYFTILIINYLEVMMKNKVIKLIVLGSLFPLLLIGCDKSSFGDRNSQSSEQNQILEPDIKELYKKVESNYQTFAENIKKDGELLKKLKRESANSPNNINEIDTSIKTDLNKLITAIKDFKNQLPQQKQSQIDSLLVLIELPNNEKENPNLASIIQLFDDGKLEKEEICENIQKPLNIKDVIDSNCGNFDNNTYTGLTEFLGKKSKEIEENIKNIKPIQEDNQSTSTNYSQFLIPIIIASVLGLGIIGSFIWIYLLNKNNKQIIDELLSQKEKIKNLQDKNEREKYNIKQLEDKINELGKLIEREYSQIQLNLGQLDNKINDLSFKSYGNQNSYSQSIHEQTPSPSVPEDVRLTNLYRENSQGLLQNAIRVSMTKETVNKVLAGTWEGLVELENNSRQGEFYIVQSNSDESYLFLDPNTKFNPQTLQNINKSQLFICNDNLSQTFKGSDINIIKPALVKQNNQYWQLIKSGEIDLLT